MKGVFNVTVDKLCDFLIDLEGNEKIGFLRKGITEDFYYIDYIQSVVFDSDSNLLIFIPEEL